METVGCSGGGGGCRATALLLLAGHFAAYHVLGVGAFNVDLRTAVVHHGPSGTMFGFDVAQHRDNELGWLLVGAPKAQTGQPLVDTGGAVYRCGLDPGSGCQQVPFDREGSNRIVIRGQSEQSDEKSFQWFGATVHSSGENGMVVACAPRYVYFSTNLRRRDPVGACWVSRSSFQGFQEYAPCRTSSWGYHRQGSCQAGLSATISKDGKRLFMGAVGSWYWQGQVFSQDLFSRQSLHSTGEAPEHDDDSYLGYSTASGEFSGDNNPDVVVGMPRGNNLTGKVVLYNSTLHNLNNITGDQIGSYFGHSLAVADVNGDGLDDIIVGAPLYTNLEAKDGSFEKGRVYIVYQNKKHQFETQSHLDGEQSKGRFGLAVSSLNDINRDGFQDIAVGAPYSGENGRGLVFIFHGSKDRIQKEPAQIIKPSDIGDPMLNTFGFSISGGMDMDKNEYPDLLIGAYDSDQVVYFRTRPVVTITPTLKVEPEKISLDAKGCSLRDNTKVSCVVVSLCIEYTGVGVPQDLALKYELKLDASKDQPRVFFLTDELKSDNETAIRILKEEKYCDSVYVYVKNKFRDKLTPISIEMSVSLVEKELKPNELQPILDQSATNNLTKYVNILKNCGIDNICYPDLSMTVKTNMNHYLIGTKDKLELDVKITNKGEDAFEAMFFLKMPLDVSYININRSKQGGSLISCQGADPERTGENILTCDLGNPLQSEKTIKFTVLLGPSKKFSAVSDLVFDFNVNSTNAENESDLFDNTVQITLPVQVEVDLKMKGRSDPELVVFNTTDDLVPTKKFTERDIGPEVQHSYEVGNTGLSVIHSMDIYLLWPSRTLDNKHLLYLVDKPRIIGNAHCNPVPDFNPEKLRLLQQQPKKGKSSAINELSPKLSAKEEKEGEPTSSPKMKRSLAETLENELVCGMTICTRIRCTINQLTKGNPVTFILRSRLWMDTVQTIGYDEFQISSKIVARVTSLPHGVKPDFLGIRTHSEAVELMSKDSDRGQQHIPLWIIILAVCGGLLLLGLLALLLWRLGFFKRKRPQEKEPLYRPEKNGYQLAKDDAAL